MKQLRSVPYLLMLLLAFSCTNSPTKVVDTGKETKDTLVTSSEIKKSGATNWVIDEKASKINFVITNFGNDVHGSFSGLKGTIHFDEKNLDKSSFETAIKVNTINTGIEKRNKDLIHEKYFDEEKYPEIIFRSDKISKSGNEYITTGDLTMKGKALKKELPFTFEEKDGKGIFKSTFTLQRLDYGIGGEGPIMGKDVTISLEVVTTKE